MNGADDISPDDDSITIAKKVLQANIYSLSNATQFLTKELLDNVLALMYSAKTLHFLGKVAPRLWLLIVSINSFDQLSVQLHF